MSTFDKCFEFIMEYEGEYSNDPHDSGGETKWGISKRSFPDIDIKSLTRDEAKEIYRSHFFNRCKCNELPAQLALVLFDSAVNQGPARAISTLQKALGVTADGKIGPETIAAAHRANLEGLVVEFIARRGYQYAMHPEVMRFGLGWMRRLSQCHQLTMGPL